ncbi:MAG: thiamine pyrophosphate-dependent enzyme [bacterium]
MNNDECKKELMTGNEAIARGFYEAGGILASSYPGSPTVEILEAVKGYPEIYSEFSMNEKVALEVAIGGSFFGSRSMVSMKHVGVNIASDPLMSFTETSINGGFLLVTGDDPGLMSSQNEQDNRIFGKFANMPILDPSDSQETKEFTKAAFTLSEDLKTPVMLRITSRLCHGRGVVELCDRVEVAPKGIIKDVNSYCMLPPNSNKAQHFMKERIEKLTEFAYDTELNRLEKKEGADTLIVTSGLMYNNLKELNPNASILKLGLVYPLSKKKFEELAQEYKNIIVLEEMTAFIENEIKLMGIQCEGKKYFSFTAELDVADIEAGLISAGVIAPKENSKVLKERIAVPARPPLFCSGCPHRPIFDVLKKVKAKTVFGDIGCYSMAFLPPFEQSVSIISMGASLGIIKGARKAMTLQGPEQPLVSVIGDGTFFHSGISGFMNLLNQKKDNENITVLILNNSTTAMTGGQQNAGSGIYHQGDYMNVNIKKLLEVIGFDRVREIDQYDYKTAKEAIEEEIAYNGLSVIIAMGPCALRYKIVKPHFFVKPEICIACKSCIKTNCPPLRMKKYEGIDKMKSSIDKNMCVGCSVCAQVCPVNAIRNSELEDETNDK